MLKNSTIDKENNIFDLVRSKCNIVDVVSHYVKLTQRGRNYVGLCPFHDDKNLGNFSVSPEKQIFNCFACNTKGDALTFVKKIEKMSYLDAARKICEIEGITIPELDNISYKKINPKLEKAYEILNDISNFYSLSLFQSKEGEKALKYLHDRGLSDEIIRKFSIGYSFNDGSKIIEFLTKEKKYSLQDIDLTGIIDLKNNSLIDKNRGRIAFSIKNEEGKVVGFSCRIFGDAKSESKYVNTPSTIAFNKSSILYNFYDAQYNARKVNYIYVLEGFMDVIACYRAGETSCVALMGTAFTKEHLELLKSLGVEIRICLDLDNPGQIGDKRIVDMLEKENISYLLVDNDVDFKYKDCDEIITNLGEERLRKYLNKLIDLPRWMINYFKKTTDLSNIVNKQKMVEYFAKYISRGDVLAEYYLHLVAEATNLSENSILNTVSEFQNEQIEPLKKEIINDEPTPKKHKVSNLAYANLKEKRLLNLESQVFYYLLRKKDARIEFLSKMNCFYSKNFEDLYNLVLSYLEDVDDSESIEIEKFIKYIEESDTKDKDKLLEILNRIDKLKVRDPYSKEIIDELIISIKKELDILTINKSNDELISKLEDNPDSKAEILELLSSKIHKKVQLVESRRKSNGNNQAKKEVD